MCRQQIEVIKCAIGASEVCLVAKTDDDRNPMVNGKPLPS